MVLAAGCFAVPAEAAIIQTTSDTAFTPGLNGFNAALGTLNSVTLKVDVHKYREWQVLAPTTQPTTYDLPWVINGLWYLDTYGGLVTLR
jgi:hypothetical protein